MFSIDFHEEDRKVDKGDAVIILHADGSVTSSVPVKPNHVLFARLCVFLGSALADPTGVKQIIEMMEDVQEPSVGPLN